MTRNIGLDRGSLIKVIFESCGQGYEGAKKAVDVFNPHEPKAHVLTVESSTTFNREP